MQCKRKAYYAFTPRQRQALRIQKAILHVTQQAYWQRFADACLYKKNAYQRMGLSDCQPMTPADSLLAFAAMHYRKRFLLMGIDII